MRGPGSTDRDFEARTESVPASIAWTGGSGSGAVRVGTPRDDDTGDLVPEKRLLAIESDGGRTMTAVVSTTDLVAALEGTDE